MAERKKNRFRTLVIAAALALTVVVLAGLYMWTVAPRSYSAVVLSNGDIYFGRLSYFPRMRLTGVYTLQALPDPGNPEQTSLQIAPIDVLFGWTPRDMALNRDQVVYISKVGRDSQVMQLINSRNASQ